MALPDYERHAACLVLDRMEIEEGGANPARLAAAIHRQLGSDEGAVPVRAIARALDIIEIREAPLVGIEAALVTTAERDEGMIVVRQAANPQRQRFSIGHELGHFLNPRHQGAWDGGFRCDRTDLGRREAAAGNSSLNPFEKQEREANEFAIELLAPLRRIQPYLEMEPSLEAALDLARGLDISREAAFRRYAERHDADLAIVFAKQDRFTYAVARDGFPRLALRRDDQMPMLPQVYGSSVTTKIEEADPRDWLEGSPRGEMFVQTLYQDDCRSTTLLIRNGDEADDDEDAVRRLKRD